MLSPPADSESALASAVAADGANRALRISESRYRRLFEAAQDGILLLNSGTAQIEDVNPYLIHMLGYSHAEFLGKKLWEVGPFVDIAQSKDGYVTAGFKAENRHFIDCVKAADLCPVIPVSMDFLTRPELIERWCSKDIIR